MIINNRFTLYMTLYLSVLFSLSSCSMLSNSEHESIDSKQQASDWRLPVEPSYTGSEDQFRCYPVSEDAFNHPLDYMAMPVAPHESIWPRIQSQLQLVYVDHPSVRAQLNWYKKHPAYFLRVQKRASRYLHFIVQALHEKQAPMDLTLLPIVESAYEPFAYSHGQASGLWQFIPGTAGRFRLQRDWWQDERRDVVESTYAAIKYLNYLNRYFDGDWLLAIAAYNAGEGTVSRAVKKNKRLGKPTDFWSLDLPRETSAYVPKMIALSEIFRDPSKHGLSLLKIDNQPYFDTVTLDSQLDLAQAAELAEIEMDELYYLNAGLNRWASPPAKDYQLKLPVAKIEKFKQGLQALAPEERITWHRYTIKSGDVLSLIAKRFATEKSIIQSVNKLKGDRIIAGKTLLIPTAQGSKQQYQLSQDQRIAKRQSIKPKNGLYKLEHMVQPGDSFWSIAKHYSVDVKALAKWNQKSPKDILRLNEKLVVWSKKNIQQQHQDKIRKVHYRVRSGDSLAKVAQKFNVSVKEISKWNKLNVKNYIQPGQHLKLFVNIADTYQ